MNAILQEPPFWIDDDLTTSAGTAFAFGDASESFLEPTLPIMTDNRTRRAKSGTVSFDYPIMVKDTGSYSEQYDVCKTPVVSSIAQSLQVQLLPVVARVTTAFDDSAPVLVNTAAPVLENTAGDNVYVFALDIWSSVADVGKC